MLNGHYLYMLRISYM
uniref:Uncharacterized protein n=1 Tax=Arundo donax TaxID=35708 RepID=A0A0A9FPU0_ARUDO